jgi:hypothetical protein
MPKEKKPPPAPPEPAEPAEPAAIAVHCHHDRLADPGSLRFNPANDNKHPEDQLRRIVAVFREIGIRHPVIVSRRSGMVVVGEGRARAAMLIPGCKVPVVEQDFESEAEELAFLAADNQLSDLSSRDRDATAALIARIKAAQPAFNMAATGYAEAQIKKMMGSLTAGAKPAANTFNYKPQFGVIIVCETEAAQEETYNALTSQGYTCKVVTT